MNREQQKEITQKKIFYSALSVFSMNTYQNASMNMISKQANVSKGIVYHYYKDKDDLYLRCVVAAISGYYNFIDSQSFTKDRFEDSISNYFKQRQHYLNEDKDLNRLFYRVLYEAPDHLKDQIEVILHMVISKNEDLLIDMLDGLTLSDNVSTEDAVEYFNMVFQSLQYHESEIFRYGADIDRVEEKIKQVVQIICYGIVRR